MKKIMIISLLVIFGFIKAQSVDEMILGKYPIGKNYDSNLIPLSSKSNSNVKGKYEEYTLFPVGTYKANSSYDIDKRDLEVKYYIGIREHISYPLKIKQINKDWTLVGLEFTIFSDKSGWKSSDFDEYLIKYTIAFGEPTYKKTSNGSDMSWVWVGKKQVLELRYFMKNSLVPPQLIIQLSDKQFYTD